MTGGPAARRWVCGGCGVAVGRIDEKRVPLPDSWEHCSDGDFCLACRRGRAADAAQAAATAPDAAPADRVKARRTGLIEFEVRRTPELTDGAIARACRTSTAVVGSVRRQLEIGAK